MSKHLKFNAEYSTSGAFAGCAILLMGSLGAILLIAVIWSVPTWLLWNWLMPEIFGLKTITLLQAFGMNLLCGGLFKTTIRREADKC